MTMTVTMLTTVMGESGTLLAKDSSYTVSDKFGAELVGLKRATDTNLALKPQNSTQPLYPYIDPLTGMVTGLVGPDGEAALVKGNPLQSAFGSLLDATSWSSHTQLFSTASQSALSNLYWPWAIKASEHIGSPLGRYYIYYSTDHAEGGVAMAYANSLAGPWAHYGLVFQDLESGDKGETPSVIWDGTVGQYRMFYHSTAAKYGSGGASSAIGNQSTLSATSSDGVTWTKDPNFILDIPSANSVNGDGHTGYFLPFMTRNGMIAHSLYGSGAGSGQVIWRRGVDTSKWDTDSVLLGYGYDRTNGMTPYYHLERNHSFVVESRGVQYLISLITDGVFGGAAKNARVICSPISANMREITEKPLIIWEPTESWESADIRSINPYVEDDVLYCFYSIAKNSIGVFSHVL